MFGRPILVCGGLLAAAIAAAWLRAEPALVPVGPPQLESGRFYAVDLAGPGRSFDLEFDAASRYEVIVSSLGDASQTHHVSLAAIPRSRVESFPAIAVTPVDRRQQCHELESRPAAVCPASGCDTETEKCGSASIPSQRRFFLHVTADALEDERGYIPVEGTLAGEGKSVRVYLDREVTLSDLAPGLIAEIIRLLDKEIIPRSREFLGEHADVDHDGKLAVLVTAWLGKLCGGRTSLKGFVRANDFQAHVAAPFGNHADVMYLNSSVEPGKSLKTLLAHEYTHAVCFSRRLADPSRKAPLAEEEDWLNEAIAHVAENMHATAPAQYDWSNLDWRIAAFLATPETSPLAVRDYYRAGLWRDPGCRGATYLFLRYCVDQFGERLLRDLVDSPVVGKRNLERATGISFPELFRRWTIALAQDDIASVRLQEKLGGCRLEGLARIEWDPQAGPCEINLHGTATSLVALKHAKEASALRIVVNGEPAAKLQVTVVRYAQ